MSLARAVLWLCVLTFSILGILFTFFTPAMTASIEIQLPTAQLGHAQAAGA